MKKIWVYLLGVLSGIVVTIIALAILGSVINAKNDPGKRMTSGMSFFETPGDDFELSSVKVLQALGDGAALAHSMRSIPYNLIDDPTVHVFEKYGDPLVLLYNEEGNPYYDDQIVKLPSGKCFRQVGIYRYTSNMGDRTVPIVMILDK